MKRQADWAPMTEYQKREDVAEDTKPARPPDRNSHMAARNNGAVLEDRKGWKMISKKIRDRRNAPRSPPPRESSASILKVAAGEGFPTESPWLCKDVVYHDKEVELYQWVSIMNETEKWQRAEWEFGKVSPFVQLMGQAQMSKERKWGFQNPNIVYDGSLTQRKHKAP